MSMPDGSWLYADSSRGIYIPQIFAQSIKRGCVAGPDCEAYWDVWDGVLNDAELTDPTSGQVFTLFQDGDLWCIPKGAEWTDSDD